MIELNPFVCEQKFKVIVKNKNKSIMATEQLLSGDRIVENPELGNINIHYLLDASKKINIFISPELRQIYINLSLPAHQVLRYIEGIIEYGQDTIYFNINKFMNEANIKSRTTVYKGIEELCRYNFIVPHHKRSNYWINPFRFFHGSRIDKYPNNLERVN